MQGGDVMPVPTSRTVHTLDPTGLVRDWLAGPAWSSPVAGLHAVLDATGSPWGPDGRWMLTNGPDVAPLKARLYALRPLVTDQALPDPVEGGRFTWVAPGGERVDDGTWRRVHTGRDGLLDWSAFCYTPERRHAVAATVLEVDQAEVRTVEVTCTGPFALWVGEELVATGADFTYMEGAVHRVPVRLLSGATRVVLATWQVAFREVRHTAALRVLGLPVRVVIPSPGADEYAAAIAEQVLDAVASPSWAVRDGQVELTGPSGAALVVQAPDGPEVRTRLHGGRTSLRIAELQGRARPVSADDPDAARTPGTTQDADGPQAAEGGEATAASMLSTGETRLTIRVDDARCPVQRELLVAVLPHERRAVPVGDDPATWRRELLEHVAGAHPGSARALARHALDPGAARVGAADLDPPQAMVDARADCADFEAVGLMHVWHRLPEDVWDPGQRERVKASLLGFKYWIDQPGLDAMCYFTENHQFVWHTAELLVGQTFTDEVFTNTGWSGDQHAKHGRELAVEWMRRKLAGGFSEFDSNAYLAIDSLALVSLVELAEDVEVRRLAEALLDKVLLTLAANSWRGVHGAAHGRSYTPTLRSSRLEETAPIMWALWGTGSLNAAVLPATALSTARAYRLPDVVRAVATDLPDHWEGRQVYRGTYRLHHDLLSRPYGSDLRVWRTPDAMLSSVQAYRAGLPGLQEHIWGATLGAEVQVFATLPAADTNSPSARPNAWAGQRVLPRGHQHRDTVLSVHGLPIGTPHGPVGGTHVWLPAAQMDEVVVHGPWLAGRVGDGYVAVAAAGGLVPTTSGDEAHQAWEPRGDGRAVVATIGRTADDGSLADFVGALADPDFTADVGDAPRVRWTARDGRVLDLGWEGPFTVDGSPDGLTAEGVPEEPPHLSNPAVHLEPGAERLEASWGGHRMVLDLAAGQRLEPASAVAESPSTAAEEVRRAR
jgi:hypothetical protein